MNSYYRGLNWIIFNIKCRLSLYIDIEIICVIYNCDSERYCGPSVGGVMVSIDAFQALDPGSIPGHRNSFPKDFIEIFEFSRLQRIMFYA